jgi:single-strand DNA-binding protein
MAASNLNVVVITGNLTRDPELRSLPSGSSVCDLRVAVNTRRKNNATGEWEDKPNYFDVKVWGAQGENCARFLSKGRPVASRDGSSGANGRPRTGKSARQSISSPTRSSSSVAVTTPQRAASRPRRGGSRSDVPVDERDFQTAASGAGIGDDDIPF